MFRPYSIALAAALVALGLGSSGFAQEELGREARDRGQLRLERALLNKRLVAKVTFPASNLGVDLHTDGTWDQRLVTRSIKDNGVGIEIGEPVTVTTVVLKGKHIELHLNGGGFGTWGDYMATTEQQRERRKGSNGKVPGGSRINLRFDRAVTEADVDNLGRLAAYLDPLVDASSLKQEIARRDLSPRFRDAAERGQITVGMDKQTVFAILGEPKAKTVDMSGDDPIEKWQYELRDLKNQVITFRQGKVSKVVVF